MRVTRPSILVTGTGQPSWPLAGRALPGYSPGSLFKPRQFPFLVLLLARATSYSSIAGTPTTFGASEHRRASRDTREPWRPLTTPHHLTTSLARRHTHPPSIIVRISSGKDLTTVLASHVVSRCDPRRPQVAALEIFPVVNPLSSSAPCAA